MRALRLPRLRLPHETFFATRPGAALLSRHRHELDARRLGALGGAVAVVGGTVLAIASYDLLTSAHPWSSLSRGLLGAGLLAVGVRVREPRPNPLAWGFPALGGLALALAALDLGAAHDVSGWAGFCVVLTVGRRLPLPRFLSAMAAAVSLSFLAVLLGRWPDPDDLSLRVGLVAVAAMAAWVVDESALREHTFEANTVAARMFELEQQCVRDPLTRLFNRRFAVAHLDKLHRQSVRRVRPLSVIALDVDHFKRVNDSGGHALGDAVLEGLAEVLLAQVRAGDVVARIGGEEFLVILPDAADRGALLVAERIREAFARMSLPGLRMRLTVSLGVATFEDGETPEQALMRADAALYAAKAGGRNRSVVAPTSERIRQHG